MWMSSTLVLALTIADEQDPVSPFQNYHLPLLTHDSTVDDPGNYAGCSLYRRPTDPTPHFAARRGSTLFIAVSPSRFADWAVTLDTATTDFVVCPTTGGDRILASNDTGIVEFTATGTRPDDYTDRSVISGTSWQDARDMALGRFTGAAEDELAILDALGTTVHILGLDTETSNGSFTLTPAADSMIALDWNGAGDDDLAFLRDSSFTITDGDGAALLQQSTVVSSLRGVRTRSNGSTDHLTIFGKASGVQYYQTYRLGWSESWQNLGYTDMRGLFAADLDLDGDEDIHGTNGYSRTIVHLLSEAGQTMPSGFVFPISPETSFTTDYTTSSGPAPATWSRPVLADFDSDGDIDLFVLNQDEGKNAIVRNQHVVDTDQKPAPLDSELIFDASQSVHTLELCLLRPAIIDPAATHLEVLVYHADALGEAADATPSSTHAPVGSLWQTDSLPTVVPLEFDRAFDASEGVLSLELRMVERVGGLNVRAWPAVHMLLTASETVTTAAHQAWPNAPAVQLQYSTVSEELIGLGCLICTPVNDPPPNGGTTGGG